MQSNYSAFPEIQEYGPFDLKNPEEFKDMSEIVVALILKIQSLGRFPRPSGNVFYWPITLSILTCLSIGFECVIFHLFGLEVNDFGIVTEVGMERIGVGNNADGDMDGPKH